MLILTPMRYCEFRQSTPETVWCDNFASTTVQAMSFCESHAVQIGQAIDQQEVMFVPVLEALQSDRRGIEAEDGG